MPIGYTPIYKIMKDDADITDRFNDRTTSIQVQLTSAGGKSDTMSITLDNRDFKLATPDTGALLRLYLGYQEVGLADAGVYQINTYDYKGGPHSLTITGTSIGFMGALKAPAIQAHDNRTLGEIIDEIAGKGGVIPRVTSELRDLKVPFFNQTMSPLHMLHELERRFGAIAKFENGFLIFKQRGDGDKFTGGSQPVLVLEPHMLAAQDGYSVRFSERTAYARVVVPYLEKTTQKQRWVTNDNTEKHGGPIDLSKGDPTKTYLYEKQMNSKEEAERQANSVMDMLRRQRCEAHFKLAKGDPWIRDQMPILVRKLFDPVNGPYVADTVTHDYVKNDGIHTSILARQPNTNKPFTLVDPDDPLSLHNLDPNQLDPVTTGGTIQYRT